MPVVHVPATETADSVTVDPGHVADRFTRKERDNGTLEVLSWKSVFEATRLMNFTPDQFVIEASVAAAAVMIATKQKDIPWVCQCDLILALNWISLGTRITRALSF